MLNKEKIEKRLIEWPEPPELIEMRNNIQNSFSNVEFVEYGHKYFITMPDGTVLSPPSVSQITHKFANEFDTEGISTRYAEKHGETAEYWQKQWKYKNLSSTITGTYVHEFGESLAWIRSGHPENICDCCKTKYVKDEGWLIPTRKKEEAVVKFWDEIPDSYHVVLPEAKIYNLTTTEQNYAGTFDLGLYYECKENPSKSGFILMDYKTNENLYSEWNEEHGKMLKPGFDHYVDCPYSMYILQLNLYQLALENIGVHVIDRRLIWLKPDGTYELVKVPDIQEDIKRNF